MHTHCQKIPTHTILRQISRFHPAQVSAAQILWISYHKNLENKTPHTIYLDLKGRSPDSLSKDVFVETDVKVIDPQGVVTYHESGNSIKSRGNSTWETEKQPYFMKLKKKTALCGMEPDRKWILMANAFDGSKILNKLFYDFSKDTGINPPNQGFVLDKYKCFVITSPDNALPEEVAYISGCFQNIDNLILQKDEAVFQYIDTDSFARRFLIEETVLNSDAFITSCYFYKRQNHDRIYAGSIWDYDSILGESNTVDHKERGNVWLNYDSKNSPTRTKQKTFIGSPV